MHNKKIFILFFSIIISFNTAIAMEADILKTKYPDYSHEFLGADKYEKFNRKMFNFNLKLNQFVLNPIHKVWTSVMPKYGMDRIKSAYTNIEYPKRLMSTLLQRDFKSSKSETVRFFTNSTLGLGGLYDPAKTLFKIDSVKEDMEQALNKCKIPRGTYLVLPIISSTTPRNIAGKILECPLDPSLYFASPITALVKMGLLVNGSSYMQPVIKMLESTYFDPYDIAKKLYAIENYIKNFNLDRKEATEEEMRFFSENYQNENNIESLLSNKNPLTKSENINEEITQNKDLSDAFVTGTQDKKMLIQNDKDFHLNADIILADYKTQGPILDSLRTSIFDIPEVKKSIWAETSIWNRCFSNKIKTSVVFPIENRAKYKYRYILQKDKNSPVAIIYPSIGEGANSHHSEIIAKLFFDEGYSVILQGSHFNWEFVNSMPENYKPGLPSQDIAYLKLTTSKIFEDLEKKYQYKFGKKVIIGTSLGAFATLLVANDEAKNNTLGVSKYISINPPIELLYSLFLIDKNNEDMCINDSDFKQKTANSVAKIIKFFENRKFDKNIVRMPFSEKEAKIITGFVLRQKLSDLVLAIESPNIKSKKDIYTLINDMSFKDYAQKYLITESYQFENLNTEASLHYIADYLKNNDNYKIYHTVNDYFVTPNQLAQLKSYSENKLVLLDNGGHLGFLYRKEFLDELKKDIKETISDKKILAKY